MSDDEAAQTCSPSSVTLSWDTPADEEPRVVALACTHDAYAEAAQALAAGKDVYAGCRVAIFPTDAPGVLNFTVASPGEGLIVFRATAAQLVSIGLSWRRMCFPFADDQPPPNTRYLDAVPEEIEVFHVVCERNWNRFDISVETIGDEARVHATIIGQVTGPTFAAMERPASWENSDPIGLLLDELDVDSNAIVTLPERAFTIAAIAAPISVAFALLTLVDLSVAVTVFGVLVPFAIAPLWERYAQAVAEHREHARAQRQDPAMWLVRRCTFVIFGVAVRKSMTPHETWKRVEYSGHLKTAIGRESPEVVRRSRHRVVRRPRFFWDRFMARRWATWWYRRVRPIHGSYPPQRLMIVSKNPLYRPVDRLRCRWILWCVRRTLMRHATSTTEARHAMDRFLHMTTWRPDRLRRRHFEGEILTARRAAFLFSGESPTSPWPKQRTQESLSIPISPRQAGG